MKNKQFFILSIFILYSFNLCFSQEKFFGRIINYDNEKHGIPLVEIRYKSNVILTDSLGYFSLNIDKLPISLLIYKSGFQNKEIDIYENNKLNIIPLNKNIIQIEEVQINTGYQWVSKERSTGSFVHLDNKILSRRNGNSIIEILEGIMPGLQYDNRSFDYRTDSDPILSVRGLNKFSTNGSGPLIIVDNVPFEGDLKNINPNDIESVTLLRDAAATSIWGARAGNGILVLNLKKPIQSDKLNVSWLTNVSIKDKPRLDKLPSITSSEFIDLELFLYQNRHYNTALNSSNSYRTVFSPVVQALYDFEKSKINQATLDDIIQSSRSHNYLDELDAYYFKKSILKEHHLSLSKKSGNNSFRFSTGFNINKYPNNGAGNANKRFTANLSNNYNLSDKFQISLNIHYTQLLNNSSANLFYPINPGGGKIELYPYAKLIGDNNLPLEIPRNYNINFVDTVGAEKLLNWHYIPLNDYKYTNTSSISDSWTNSFILNYSIISNINLEAFFNKEILFLRNNILYDKESYFVRDLVNRYSKIENNIVKRPIPFGDILNHSNSHTNNNRFRLLARMDENVFSSDKISLVLGTEITDSKTVMKSQRSYGYDSFFSTSIPVDYSTPQPLFLGGNATIPNLESFSQNVSRLISVFSNASYSISNKYIISGSIRKDASNRFGIKANQRWNPLWSVGGAWNLTNEKWFVEKNWIDNIRLRATHGHSGNLGGGVISDRVVIDYSTKDTYTNLPYASIKSPPNASLKWENIQMDNIALDFNLFNGRVSGSGELYFKKVTDLISSDLIDPTTGFSNVTRNVGGLNTKGFDINVKFAPFSGPFKWILESSLSYSKEKVTSFYGNLPSSQQLVSNEVSVIPILDKVLMPVFSYKFAGLEGSTGDPLGYFENNISKNYTQLISNSIDELVYHGSARPLYFGYVNTSFQYKDFTVKLNSTFRAGHYFRSKTVNYNQMFNSWITHSDYTNRWQQSGDEKFTNIPSLVYPAISSRDNFFQGSESNIHKGDVIRIHNIQFLYQLDKPTNKISRIEFDLNIDHIGIIWKASKVVRDPDYLTIPPSKNVSMKIRLII